MAEVRSGRTVAQVVLVFLLAVVIGRLMLERTGVGQGILFVAIPLAFILLMSLYGARTAAVLVVVMLGVAWLIRAALSIGGGGWIIVLMLPLVVAVLAMATHVVVTLVRDRRAQEGADPGGPASGEEREEE